MIRINLLTTERQNAARRAPAFDIGKRITLACSLIVVAAGGGIGWWYWSLTKEASAVEAQIKDAQRQVVRLKPIIAEVAKFESQRQQLQERVQLIEQLRKGQGVPVQLLDQVSRSLPDMLWLTSMQQDGAAVTIQGRSTTLVGLSDFVGNLGSSNFFKKPIEIVDSKAQAEKTDQSVDLITFTVKAQLLSVPGETGSSPKGK